MSESDYTLPLNVNGRIQGYLEIKVSRINLKKSHTKQAEDFDSQFRINNIISTSSINNINLKKSNINNNCSQGGHHLGRAVPINPIIDSCGAIAIVSFIWCGENCDNAVSLYIAQYANDIKSNHTQNKRLPKEQETAQVLHCRSKLHYGISTSLALFLDYLRSCKPIKIVVSGSIGISASINDCGNSNNKRFCDFPLGQAYLPLPGVFLRKYVANYKSSSPSAYKTKIYALYNKIGSISRRSPTTKIQQTLYQQLKTSEIQLRSKMLFAPSAKHSPVLQDQLHSLQCHHELKVNSGSAMQAVNHNNNSSNVQQRDESKGAVEISPRKRTQSDEIVQAMKKLDAKLVAYLAGEDIVNTEENQLALGSLSDLKTSINTHIGMSAQLDAFMSITAMKLQMEALTLQPEGTKRMELLQSDIRPIFTVECQLSHELIKGVARYDMFNIMQFESEKFQSLTQCTRFGQEAQREIRLPFDENDSSSTRFVASNLGRIHFCVWWREPGTCLNELLGMGVLELKDLYDAALLEQCKRIGIKRRDVHLANLYFKISMHTPHQVCGIQNTIQEKAELVLEQVHGHLHQQQHQHQHHHQHQLQHQHQHQHQHMQQPSVETSFKQHSGADDEGENRAMEMEINDNGKMRTDNEQLGNSAATATDSRAANSAANTTLVSSSFTAETSKVRLLKGYIYANETRNINMSTSCGYILVCRRFWHEEEAATLAGNGNQFNYQEQFAVLNDEKFLHRVDKQYVHLEVWRCEHADDGNGNAVSNAELVGVVRLPLHQFYIAYRDATITNHLCKGKLPVISIDTWVLINGHSGASVGELKCLLAIGSEEQIKTLKELRGFSNTGSISSITACLNTFYSSNGNNCEASTERIKSQISGKLQNEQKATIGKKTQQQSITTSQLLDVLHKDMLPPAAPSPETATATMAMPSPSQQINSKTLKFALDIYRAIGLPLNSTPKNKKSWRRNIMYKRFPPNEAPSTYVTFQADDCRGKVYKLQNGDLYATKIFEKSTEPRWQSRFRVITSMDYLTNPQKRFIFKIWKKANPIDLSAETVSSRIEPSPLEDAVIGFAALDLTPFVRGVGISGWISIVDFNGRVTGQLGIRCKPLEDVERILPLASHVHDAASDISVPSVTMAPTTSNAISMDAVIDQFACSLDLTHLNLSEAIKRKFTELEGISQRLRTRLVDVTGEQLSANFDAGILDNWEPLDTVLGSNADLDEFERDINALSASSASLATESQFNTNTAITVDKYIDNDNANDGDDNVIKLISATASTAEPIVPPQTESPEE